jgi:hypothetical protein
MTVARAQIVWGDPLMAADLIKKLAEEEFAESKRKL